MSTVDNIDTMGTAQENNNPSVALSNSVVSAHSSFENNVVVEEWKGKIDREFTLEKLPPSRSSAALMIQNFFRSFRNRRTFKIIKTVLAQAEETITKKVLRQVNPSEAHLTNDPSLRARVRFRLGGSSWPPIVLYKIYTSVPFRYIDGKIVQSNYAGKIENQGVYTRRQYQKFISCLDKKPVHAGGRGNSWRPLFRTQKVDNSNTTNNFNNYNNSLMNNNYNRRGKLSFPSKMRSNVIETRLGAGGGMVGPKHLIGKEIQQNGSRDNYTPRKYNARWQSSIPKRRPGTTTDAGRRMLREGMNNGNNNRKYRRRMNRPRSAAASRSRRNRRGITSSNKSIGFNKKNRKHMKRSKPSSSNRKLRLKGNEIPKTMTQPKPSLMKKAPSSNKLLTPNKYRSFVNKNSRPSSGRRRRGESGKKNILNTITSWDTVPESEVNDLYAWSTALNIDQDLQKLLWVKTSPS